MKLFRLLLGFIYVAFSLMALPMADCGQPGATAMHSCCCTASGGCNMPGPMDCCADDGDDLPLPPQIPTTQFSLEVPFFAQDVSLKVPEPQISNLKSQISNPKSFPVRVKTYIAYHRLVFYA